MKLFYLVTALCGAVGIARAHATEFKAGAIVTLRGTLSRTWDFGPPNYGENPESDAIEHWVTLSLGREVGISDRGTGMEFSHVRQVQLVCFPQDQPSLWSQIQSILDMGYVADVAGEVEAAANGHHHEPLLLKVSKIKAVDVVWSSRTKLRGVEGWKLAQIAANYVVGQDPWGMNDLRLPVVITNLGPIWQVSYELQNDVVGEPLTVDIDKKSMKAVRLSGAKQAQ